MKDMQYWVEKLELLPHPEGGYYRETYLAQEKHEVGNLPARFTGDRLYYSSIYFLIDAQHFSAFHKLQADEIWHHYTGETIHLHLIDPEGTYRQLKLGKAEEASFQLLVPAHTWFAASVETQGGYALAGCTMAPGFDFEDFEMADRQELITQYPQHHSLIQRYTRI